MGASAVDRPRLSRPHGIFDSLASSEMRATLSSALERLGDAGAEVCDFDGTHLLEPMLRDHRIIMASEASAVHRGLGDAKPRAYPPRIAELLREGDAIRELDYLQASGHLSKHRFVMDEWLKRAMPW